MKWLSNFHKIIWKVGEAGIETWQSDSRTPMLSYYVPWGKGFGLLLL